jgi:hypothetical protein
MESLLFEEVIQQISNFYLFYIINEQLHHSLCEFNIWIHS